LERAGAPVGFDLLVIDVEGAERQVFAGFDLEKWMPKTLLVELEDEHPDFLDNQRVVRDAGMIRSRIEAAGYRDISAITSTRSMLEMMCSKTQNPKSTLRNWLESRALRCPGDPCLGRSKRGVTGVEPVEPGHDVAGWAGMSRGSEAGFLSGINEGRRVCRSPII
jgi:hypothetical protein